MTRGMVTAAVALVVGWAAVASAQVKLEHKIREGSDARFQAVTKTHQILDIDGMKVETRAEENPTIRWTVGARNPDGTLPVRQTLEAIRTHLELPGGVSVSFDSANPDARPDDPQLAIFTDIYKALVGMEITFVLDKDNQVQAVEGAEKALSRATELNPQVGELLKGNLDPDKLKAGFTQHLVTFPPVLLRAGDTWDRTETLYLAGGQSLTFQKRYEYQGTVERDGSTLDQVGAKVQGVTYAMEPNAQSPVKVSQSDLKIESSEGTILFDREQGVPVESKGVTRITGDLTLVAGEKELPTKLDLTLDISAALLKQE